MSSWSTAAAVGLAALAVGACGTTVEGAPSPVPPAATSAGTGTATAEAGRSVCVDLDARGGQLYAAFVVPMMGGPSGRKSIDVDIAIISRAVGQVAQVGAGGSLDRASGEIADEGERMVAAAEAFQVVEHFEGTALLTSFVGLAVACQQAGHKPSWFDPVALIGS
jgi:hypothetical protein